MSLLHIFERDSPEVLTREQLDTALSGLSILSRNIFKDEITKAQLDTTMEYHRIDDPEIKKQLWNEIQCLNALIASCMRVCDEVSDFSKVFDSK